jgi:nucleoside-diphosphate-sugar epimerase
MNNVDVRDVARLTLYPIEHPAEADGQRYIAHAAEGHPQAIADILRKAFPEARNRIKEGTPGEGYTKGYQLSAEGVQIDSEKGRKALGGWTAFEKSVVDTAKALEHLV